MNGPAPEWPPATPGLTTFFQIAEGRDAGWFLRRHAKWIVTSGLLALLIGVAWVYLLPPRYVSKATLRFLPPQVAGRFVNPNFSMEVGQRMFALGQLLSSRLTATRMIESFQLYPELRRFQTVEDLTKRFQADLQVVQVGNGIGDDKRAVPTLQISYAYPNVEKAQKVVQKLIEQVYEENRKYRGDQSLGTTEFLEEQLGTAEEHVLEVEQRLGELQDSIGLTVSQTKLGQNTSRSYVVDSRLRDLRHDRRLLEERRASKRAEWEQLELLQRRIETRPWEFYAPEFEGMQHYWHLKEKANLARVELDRLKGRYQSNMPDVVSAELEVRESEKAIDHFQRDRGARLRQRDLETNAGKIALAKLELQALERESTEQGREENELRVEAQRLHEQPNVPQGQEVELLAAKREYEAANEQYQMLLKKFEESRTASDMERRGQGENIEMLEPASRPVDTERPTAWMRILIVTLAGCLLAVVGCLIQELRNPKLLHEGHVENWSGLPVLASFALAVAGKKVSKRAVATTVAVLMLSGCSMWKESAGQLTRKAEQAEREGKLAVALLLYRQALREDARWGAAYEGMARLALRAGELEAARDALARAVELNPDRHPLVKQLADTSYQVYFDDPSRPVAVLREVEALAERLRAKWPGQPDGHRILAQVWIERHRTEEAIELLEKAAVTVKQNETLKAQMAVALFRSGQPERAAVALEEVIAQSPGYLDAYDLLYLQLMQRRQSAEARAVLEKKLKNTGLLEAGLQLAAHEDAHGNRQAAAAILAGLQAKAEATPMGLARTGDFWLERRDWNAAREAYEAGRQHEPALAADYVCRLAEWHLAQGQTQAARQWVEAEHAKLKPQSLLLDAYLAAVRLGEVPAERRLEERKRLESILLRMPDSPFVRYHLGRAYLMERKLQPAAEQFERSVRLDANYAAGWLALAEVEMRRGNAVSAELKADAVLRRNPASAQALMVQARAQAQRGKFAEAERGLRIVIDHEPANAEARYLLAVSSVRQGNVAEAEQHLRAGAEAQPNDARWPLALAALWSGQGKTGPARELLEKTAGSGALEQLAGLQIEMRDGSGAVRTFGQLVSRDGKNLEYQLGMAGAKALAGDRAGALDIYSKLQKQIGSDARVWLQPAALLSEMGRTDEARGAYERVLELAPNHPQALNNLAWLLLERHQEERRALELAQRAKQAVRQSPEVDGTLAAAFSRMEMYRNAVATYEEMLSYLPQSERPRVEKLLAESRKKMRKDGTT